MAFLVIGCPEVGLTALSPNSFPSTDARAGSEVEVQLLLMGAFGSHRVGEGLGVAIVASGDVGEHLMLSGAVAVEPQAYVDLVPEFEAAALLDMRLPPRVNRRATVWRSANTEASNLNLT
ncbi:hypothetical protein [Streptomyces virginiae]|uniref:hypothetical protein n=1 Tax=Streptomyces virginiae TaxID=1961 RepID=UPI00367B5AB8